MGSSISHVTPANAEKPPLIKVPFMGAEKAGKTSLISRFEKDKFDVSVPQTVAIDLAIVNISIGEQIVRLAIWDCSGKERYWKMVPQLARDALVVVAVYDIASEQSLNEALRMVEGQVAQAKVQSTIFLVGNKVDLEGGRQVSVSTGEEVAKNKGYVYVETSAMTGENVRWLFEEIARRYLERKNQEKTAPKLNNHMDNIGQC